MTEPTRTAAGTPPASVTSTDLANRSGGLLTDVMEGRHLVITRTGRPVAALVPIAWYQAKRSYENHLTACVLDDGEPLDRDEYAAWLAGGGLSRLDDNSHVKVTLDAGEAEAVASLLDELAAVYPDERLGRLANQLAVKINDRAGWRQ